MKKPPNELAAVDSPLRDWDAELRAIWPGKAEWVEPVQVEDEDPRGWHIRLDHQCSETLIYCFEDADDPPDGDDDVYHRSRSMHPRLAKLADHRFSESEAGT